MHPNTVKEGNLSLRCDSFSCTSLDHGQHYRIVRCRKCGLMYSNPRHSFNEIEDAYRKVTDEVYCEASASRIRTFEKLFRRPEIKKAGKTLLDIGCYTGLFMHLAGKRGFHVSGIEPSSWAAKIGIDKYGLDIINESIYSAQIERKFDLITMWDTIEHLNDPYRALKICYDKLADNGIIAISTMRCSGLFYAFCGRRWPWFMRMHSFYFTEKTLSMMLEKAGFLVLAIYPYTHYISLDYLFYKIPFLNMNFLLNRHNKAFKKIVFPVRMGDFMEIYAIKH